MTEYKYKTYCPYRVCPVGAHIDHQQGVVTGFALDRGVNVYYSPSPDTSIRVISSDFDGGISFDLTSIPTPQNDYGNYFRGAALKLDRAHTLHRGITASVEGSLPVGGLSSSAAVTIAFLKALSAANEITLTAPELVTLSRACENGYVGVNSGTLDQCAEIYSKKNALLVLDTADNSRRLIPRAPTMPEFDLCIVFGGRTRTLASAVPASTVTASAASASSATVSAVAASNKPAPNSYNSRVTECRMAAFSLLTYACHDVADPNMCCLRDVPREFFDRFAVRLPDNYRNRAVHYFTETDRVRDCIDAWERGDLAEFGRHVTDSGHSSIVNYECGSDETTALYNILRTTDGVYGTRFCGAGFGGSVLAISDPSRRDGIRTSVTGRFLEQFPEREGDFGVYFCKSADGCEQ